MALHSTATTVTSDVTPETARLVGPGSWELDWLPGIPLSYDQAVSGMVLDEVLSDPATVGDEMAVELAAVRAADLGLDLRSVLLRLSVRIAERDATLSWQPVSARAARPAGAEERRPCASASCSARHRAPTPSPG